MKLDFDKPRISRDFTLSEKTFIRFSYLQDLEDKQSHYLSARMFVKTNKYEGPTNKGFLFSTELMEEFLSLYEEILEQQEMILVAEELGVSLKISDADTLHLRVTEYEGEYSFDIRVWVETNKYKGWTKKGFKIPLTHMRSMYEMINTIDQEALDNGI